MSKKGQDKSSLLENTLGVKSNSSKTKLIRKYVSGVVPSGKSKTKENEAKVIQSKSLKIAFNIELENFFYELSVLKIYVIDKQRIKRFLEKYPDSIKYFIDMLKNARNIFGKDRELIVKRSGYMSNYLDLVVRQKTYSEDDGLDELIYKVINYNSKIFVKNKMQTKITVDTDYDKPQYIKNEQKVVI